jgi:hypothetical protein
MMFFPFRKLADPVAGATSTRYLLPYRDSRLMEL